MERISKCVGACREKMIEAQKLLAEAKRLQKVADLKEDQAEEAQEKARAADFIRVKSRDYACQYRQAIVVLE